MRRTREERAAAGDVYTLRPIAGLVSGALLSSWGLGRRVWKRTKGQCCQIARRVTSPAQKRQVCASGDGRTYLCSFSTSRCALGSARFLPYWGLDSKDLRRRRLSRCIFNVLRSGSVCAGTSTVRRVLRRLSGCCEMYSGKNRPSTGTYEVVDATRPLQKDAGYDSDSGTSQ